MPLDECDAGDLRIKDGLSLRWQYLSHNSQKPLFQRRKTPPKQAEPLCEGHDSLRLIQLAIRISAMICDFPPEIIAKRFGEDFRGVGLRHDDVMFKTFFADVA